MNTVSIFGLLSLCLGALLLSLDNHFYAQLTSTALVGKYERRYLLDGLLAYAEAYLEAKGDMTVFPCTLKKENGEVTLTRVGQTRVKAEASLWKGAERIIAAREIRFSEQEKAL